jgi:hypothetical protein
LLPLSKAEASSRTPKRIGRRLVRTAGLDTMVGMKPLSDTSPEAERVLAGAYRAMSPTRKWLLLGDLYRMGRSLHASGLRLREPGATPSEIRDNWLTLQVGNIPRRSAVKESGMDQSTDNLRVLREVLAVFDSLAIAYALGGSLASGIHGITRYTSDADVSVEPFEGLEDRLAASIGPDYYVSVEAIRQALRDRSTFNIINTSVGFKVDVFIRKDRTFDRSLMARRIFATMADVPDRPVAVVTAEDSILLKLEWYRLGGEISDRQWSDILGIMRVQADRLDQGYLDHWAADLGVNDLLADARRDAAL